MGKIIPTKTAHGYRPKKRLGQHFLKDRKIIRRIIDRAGFLSSHRVLEIGPGLGALTIPLAGTVKEIIAVEKDPVLVELLSKKIENKGIENIRLVENDILKLDLEDIAGPGEKLKVIGNLPYNISSPFLEMLVNNRHLISEAVLMFQYEFGKRMMASPNSKEYGSLTVMTRYHARVFPLLEVSPEAFYPRPKVGSMVLGVDLEGYHARRAIDYRCFNKVVKGAFAHRRKTILNSLKDSLFGYSHEDISNALEICDIDSKRRAETLHIDDFLCLADRLMEVSRNRH